MGDPLVFESLQHVPVGGGWFEVYALEHQVFAICEPHHFQEVISYLIIGNDRSVLLDTGMGLANIKAVVEKLTDTPITVVNTHAHFDHVGGNHLFEQVLAFDEPDGLSRLQKGCPVAEMAPQAQASFFQPGYAQRFDMAHYSIKPCAPTPIGDGHMLDLGNRQLQVLHTPGHSPDSIMLLDEANGLLFTGDTFYPGHLYAYCSGPLYGDSNIQDYAASMEKVCRLLPKLRTLHPAHNEPMAAPNLLLQVAQAFNLIVSGKAETGMPFFQESSMLLDYDFGSFHIITSTL